MDHTFQISAVILASGMSKRMGTTKQLLLFEGIPLLEIIIRKLLLFPFQKVYAVVGYDSMEIMNRIHMDDQRFEWKFNPRFQEGQSTSLQEAAKALENQHGIMVFLADQPLILNDTIRLIYHHAEKKLGENLTDFVIQPSFSGQKGHPVFFSSNLISFFSLLKADEGGKRVINQAKQHFVLPVDDPGIVFDVDTPEDYQILLSKESNKL